MQEQAFNSQTPTIEDNRTGNSVAALKQAILENLFFVMAKRPEAATDMDHFMALAYTVRDRILARWIATLENYVKHDARVVCYLSAEFLMGPHLANNMLNLGLTDTIRKATEELDLDLDHLIRQE